MEPIPFYRPRNPRTTPLWTLAETHYERLRLAWEERLEARSGFWRGLADEAVARYLDCGIPEMGQRAPARSRDRVVRRVDERRDVGVVVVQSAVASEPDTAERRQLRKNWAALIRRVYEVDPLLCPCGATMRIVAVITVRSVITKILAHLAKAAAASATEGAGCCDHRMGRSLFGPAHSPAQARPRRPSRRARTAATTETACTFLVDRFKLVGTDGNRGDKLERSHSVDSSAKCFFLSLRSIHCASGPPVTTTRTPRSRPKRSAASYIGASGPPGP